MHNTPERPRSGPSLPAPAPRRPASAPQAGRKRSRRQPPARVGGPAWRNRRISSAGLSIVLHSAVLLTLLGLRLPVATEQIAEKPREVIEVEFVQIPTTKPAKAAAPPPVEKVEPAPDPVPQAPVKPVAPPKAQTAAVPKPLAPRVAPKPQLAARPAPVAPVAPAMPVKRAPTQAELAKLAAARFKGSTDQAAERLAAVTPGALAPDEAPAAPAKPAGRPIASHDSPLGELSGRGVLSAVTPQYPVSAQQRIQEGTVQVRVWVDANGAVARTAVERSSGFPALDAAARRAAAAYRFSPLADGEGELQSGAIPFVFVIK